jgi:hypothetical protein
MDDPLPRDVTPRRPPLPLTGGCPCGAIRYQIDAYPLLAYACHCTECQRQSGSAFAVNMPVPTPAFRIVQGTPKGWRHLSPSGVEVVSWFCGDCSGRINGERAGRPETTNVRAGSLDDTSWLSMGAHLFVRSAQPWVQLSHDTPCFEESPADFRPLAKAWLARWGGRDSIGARIAPS